MAENRPDAYLDSLPVLQPGQRVLVDGKTPAEVVGQSPRRMFTIIKESGMSWTVMTDRITHCENANANP